MSNRTVIYLPGLVGHPGASPALQQVAAAGWDIVVPDLPGFNGRGYAPPSDYLEWIQIFWDAIDATGVGPSPVIGASVGGMMATELAALRPERVTCLALLAPFGICDAANPGFDLYATPAGERPSHLFAKGVPDAVVHRFAELGAEEAPVARYLCETACASLLWPLGDRGTAKRLPRVRAPRLTMFGELDELIPPSTAALWGDVHMVAGAGHLLEWDTPDEVGARLVAFLEQHG